MLVFWPVCCRGGSSQSSSSQKQKPQPALGYDLKDPEAPDLESWIRCWIPQAEKDERAGLVCTISRIALSQTHLLSRPGLRPFEAFPEMDEDGVGKTAQNIEHDIIVVHKYFISDVTVVFHVCAWPHPGFGACFRPLIILAIPIHSSPTSSLEWSPSPIFEALGLRLAEDS